MRWLLDTNVIIDAFAGKGDAIAVLRRARSDGVDWVGYSSMTRLEVLGFAGLSTADDQGLRELLAEFNEVNVTRPIIDEAIRIRKTLKIKTPDALIAATSLVETAELITRNTRDFRGIPGLRIVDAASH